MNAAELGYEVDRDESSKREIVMRKAGNKDRDPARIPDRSNYCQRCKRDSNPDPPQRYSPLGVPSRESLPCYRIKSRRLSWIRDRSHYCAEARWSPALKIYAVANGGGREGEG